MNRLTALLPLFATLLLTWGAWMAPAQADEYRPAYLELKQKQAEVFDMLWKVPARQDKRLSLYVTLPADIETTVPVRTTYVGTAFIERSTIRRPGGLTGAEIDIDGLRGIATEVLVRIVRLDGTTEVARLTPDATSFVVAGTPTTGEVAKAYVVFGIEHIWAGTDHLLFVACLLFIARTGRRILITITGFTLAHSVTLSLAALQLVSLPVPPIEATIALSIVFLAREIARKDHHNLTWRYPIAVSSSFGLLHGFGFASALGEIGLPQTEIPAALLSFNVGVEVGQVLFVLAIFAVVWVLTHGWRTLADSTPNWRLWLEKPMAYVVGAVAMLWTIERVSGF
jgi:hydrogenase/urease accessory protein HupE